MNAAPPSSAAQLDVSFTYCAPWLARAEPAQIAAIAPTAHVISSPDVTAPFENLLREVAGDTAGGFVILPAGQRPELPSGLRGQTL